jgi:hypothetical protein
MLLREHPDMKFRTAQSWPPSWIILHRDSHREVTVLRGEIGLLKDVLYYSRLPTQIFLIMTHEGSEYMSVILFDDPSFCEDVARHLDGCRGMSIEAIGAFEIDKLRHPPYVI